MMRSLLPLTLALITLLGCRSVPMTPMPTAAEEAAIRAVIDRQTTSFYNRDLDAYLDLWAQLPHAMRLFPDGERETGWQAVEQYYTDVMNSEPVPVADLVYEPRDIQMYVYDDAAWVINNQHVAGDVLGSSFAGDQWVLRFLEKRDDEWKIVMIVHGVIPE